jgi:hypothetical protein
MPEPTEQTEAPQDTTPTEPVAAATAPVVDAKKLADAEIARQIQSAIDAKKNTVFTENQSLKKRLEELETSKLTEDQRRVYQLEQKEKEIAEKDALVRNREVELNTFEVLASKNLPLELKEFVRDDTREGIERKAAALERHVSALVKQGVEAALAKTGVVPAGLQSDSRQLGKITREALKTMTSEEIAKAYKEGRVEI